LEIDEFKIYETLFHAGIKPEVINLIPAKLQKIIPYYDNGYILETDNGSLALWTHRGPEVYLACQLQILKLCMQQGFRGFLYPLPLTDGRNYAELNEGCWFFITAWPGLQKVHFSLSGDLKAMVTLLATFRKIIHDNGFLYYLSEKKSGFNLLEKYQEITKQLISFEMLAKNRLRPTIFDRQFLSYLTEIRRQIEVSIGILEDSNYLDVITRLTSMDMIINKLTRHNLRLDNSGRAVCLQLDDYRWDLPIVDLAILLIKTGRSAKWDPGWYQMMLNEYETHFTISSLEMKVIRAYITFPWSFYRLVSRYYYNRVNWAVGTFTEKMARVMEDEINRKKFFGNSL
jgi:CotS family spore coat protein